MASGLNRVLVWAAECPAELPVSSWPWGGDGVQRDGGSGGGLGGVS